MEDPAEMQDSAVKLKSAERINIDPKQVEQGLAKLVLTLIELIRKLMEKQAARRVESGSLTDEQIEKMGETFIKLDKKMAELKEIFNVKDEELNLNLGPLGDLM
ncbi:MAG: gas vesicle protein K [Candidatus Margulisiibacteriota bacterium]